MATLCDFYGFLWVIAYYRGFLEVFGAFPA